MTHYTTRYGETRIDRGQRCPTNRGDPHWIVARYAGRCVHCGATIQAGDRAFYYPNGRAMYCDNTTEAQPTSCARTACNDFLSTKGDEE
jgi:hypothetical protein